MAARNAATCSRPRSLDSVTDFRPRSRACMRATVTTKVRKASHGSSISSASRAIWSDALELGREHRLDERLAVREAAVEGPDPDAGGRGDVLDRDVDAALGEQGLGGLDDALAIALGVSAKGAGGGHVRDQG